MYAQGGGSISLPPSALFTLFIPTSVRIGSQLNPVLMHIAFAGKVMAVDGFLHSEIIPIARIVIRAIRACCSAGRFALRQAAEHTVDHRHRRRAGDISGRGLLFEAPHTQPRDAAQVIMVTNRAPPILAVGNMLSVTNTSNPLICIASKMILSALNTATAIGFGTARFTVYPPKLGGTT